MRLLVLFLAMYVLVLSGVPCDTLCQDEPTATAAPGTPAHSDKQGDCKSCSPFSMCAACTGFTLPAPVWAVPVARFVPTASPARLPGYRVPDTLEVAACIWQPPRLA
jgi:hypothetical protein